jgi:hypothetical protein
MFDGNFISLALKTLIIVIIITICLSAVVFYYRNYYTNPTQKSGFEDFKVNPGVKYVMWIGDAATTLDILALAQQPGLVIQPIYIPDPQSYNTARTEYELQITRTLRTMINTKYTQSQILPIISITRQQPDDAAFNKEYDFGPDDGASDTLTRENILRRWAKYYKLTITQPSTTTASNSKPNKLSKILKTTNKKSDARILAETWNCRFPIGANQVPCGLCTKCEKMNSLTLQNLL